jgi:hypothetical protein
MEGFEWAREINGRKREKSGGGHTARSDPRRKKPPGKAHPHPEPVASDLDGGGKGADILISFLFPLGQIGAGFLKMI